MYYELSVYYKIFNNTIINLHDLHDYQPRQHAWEVLNVLKPLI